MRPVAIVTGAARRVGRAVALRLAEGGYDLELTVHQSRAEGEETVGLCRERGARASLSVLDLSDDEAVERAGSAWVEAHREIAAVVHNAALYESTEWGTVTSASAMAHFRINAMGPLLLTQAITPALRAGGGCAVVFTDIHAAGRPRKRYAAYSLSKSAAIELVRVLARELAPEARAVGIAPGVIAWPADAAEAERRAYEARIPLKRPGTPQDAAELVAFLISRKASYITGEVVRLDGGRYLT